MNKVSGLTLVELMITTAIISIGVLAFVASFGYITKSMQYSKGKTLANNLVMEQVEKLKNLQYYSLLVTTSTYSDNRFTPPLLYDTGNYPYQTPIIQGGITFTRGTRVDYAYQFGTTITTAPYTSDDTGLKLISVYVIWQDASGLRYQEIHNLMANPAANPLNATFNGTVTASGGGNIAGAVVRTIDNPNFYGTASGTGAYSFSVSSGNYTLNCSSQGYFSQDKPGSVQAGLTTTIPFTLTKMSSGTASGTAYIDNHLVISQVVASTGSSNDLEYIELYNPTTYPISIGDNNNTTSPSVVPILWDSSNNPTLRHLVYVSSSVPANGGYYIIANTGNANPATNCNTAASLVINGATLPVDACWQKVPYPQHAIECGGASWGPGCPDAGGVSLGNTSSYSGNLIFTGGNWPNPGAIDRVGWKEKGGLAHAAPPNAVEGTAITPQTDGLQPGEQLLRNSFPGSYQPGKGSAYDSNNNVNDIVDLPSIFSVTAPHNSSTINAPVSGTPAAGAYVTVSDPLSSTAQCDSGGNFTVPGIATGTWTVAISTNSSSSASYYLEVANVQMTANLSTGVPNGSTLPTWPAGTTLTNALLNNTTTMAFITGVVTDANNIPLNNIQVNAGGKIVNTNASGRYFVSTPAGDVLVIANNGNQNKSYASQSYTILGTGAGQVYDIPPGNPQCTGATQQCTWFQLSLAGTLVGYFQTSSLTALPGQTLVALSGGNQVAQAVSDNTGHAFITNLATGTYTLSPQVDPASSVSPTGPVVTLSSTGTATSYSTFTVTNGLAQITGQVLIAASTAPITTGALVLASTTSLGGGSLSMPPTQNGGAGALCAPCYYGASSDATGNYTVYVRSSTTPYQLYGWYTTFAGTTPSTTRQGPFSVTISTAGVIQTQNISW